MQYIPSDNLDHNSDRNSGPFNEERLNAFLNKTGWTKSATIGQDTSIRRYFRVVKNEKFAILMESVPDDSPHMTRGHTMAGFIRIGEWLRETGLNAPDIYEQDLKQGYMLLEDFGDTSFKRAVASGQESGGLYKLGVDVLERLSHASDLPSLPAYYDSHIHHNHRYIIEWYLPRILGASCDLHSILAEYRNVWEGIEHALPPCPKGFVHCDFHAENLMLLAEGTGLQRCGILDFQGAMMGPVPYDLVNLLEDVRLNVPPDLAHATLSRFDDSFLAWYRVLGTQFHCRVLGQFIKLAVDGGNHSYLRYIPRIENYMRENLKNPVLRPLKKFFDDLKVDFSGANDLNV